VTITVQTTGDTSRVAVRGDLDLVAAPELNAALEGLARTVVVDLSVATYVDSTGLAVLVGHRRRARTRGETLRVVGPPERVLRAFALAGVDELLVG
jgi:anti-sigma B factor antagonist